jgi:hypothetical protein
MNTPVSREDFPLKEALSKSWVNVGDIVVWWKRAAKGLLVLYICLMIDDH